MPRMPDLAVVEGCDTHEDAGSDRYIVFAVRIEAPRHLERPMSGGPAGCAANVGAVAGELA
jgi:hypothetical protein